MATQQPPYDGSGRGGAPPPGNYPAQPGGSPPPPLPAPPPPRKSNTVWWIVGGSVGGLLLLCCLGAFAFSALFGVGIFAAVQATAGPRDATTEYFEAVERRDWTAAHDHLSARLRAANTPATLQATWTRREATNGAVTGFDVDDTNITNDTATVTGTLRYQGGRSESRRVTLVKEGDDWKISSPP